MKCTKVIGTFVAIVMLMAGTTTAYADVCQRVRFKFTNRHKLERPINVIKVRYWDKSDKVWRTVNLQHGTECPFNKTCTTGEEDLAQVENEVIEKIRFIYKEQVSGNWTGEIEGGDKIPDRTTACVANITYGPAPDGFIIWGVAGD